MPPLPGLDLLITNRLLVYNKNISQDIYVLALNAGIVLDPRDHSRALGIADIDDSRASIVRCIGEFPIATHAKLSDLIPAIEVAVRKDREIFDLAIARLPLLSATENLGLTKRIDRQA
jgi:hypothetical protein